jgi:hypothetical protein
MNHLLSKPSPESKVSLWIKGYVFPNIERAAQGGTI